MDKEEHLQKIKDADAAYYDGTEPLMSDAEYDILRAFYPSSQTCSVCGYRHPLTKDLSVCEWDCLGCGAHHDSAVNAAKNKALEDKSNAA